MIRSLLKRLVWLYQVTLRGMLPPSCRFHPSCSNYALEALDTHGALKGSWLAVRRVSRCHPFNPGGYDPVPPAAGSPCSCQIDEPEVPRKAHNPGCEAV